MQKRGIFLMIRLSNGLRTLFCICFALAALSIVALNGYALALAVAAGIWLLLRRRTIPRFTLVLLIGGFVLRVVVALVLHPPIISDFKGMYEAAQGLLAGDMTFWDSQYFSLWAYQTLFVVWEAFLLAICNSPFFIELVNGALAAATVCLLYRMGRRWVGERAAQAASLLLTLFPFALTLHTLLSNQIPSAFFLVLGIWVLACDDCRRLGWWRYPLAGLALQAGNLLRSEGIVCLVAVLAWAVFQAVQHPKQVKRVLAGLLALFVVYFAAHAGAAAIVRTTGLNPYGLSNNNPTWKFVTGLNPDSRGTYSQQDWDRIVPTLDEHYQVTEETEALQNELIEERLSAGPVALMRHLINKWRMLWDNDALYWAMQHTVETNPQQTICGLITRQDAYELVQQFDRGIFYIAVLLAGYGLVAPRSRWKKRTAAAYLPYFVFFAMCCAMVLIEVQPRYAYLPQQFLFLAAGFGLECIANRRKEDAPDA